MVIFSLHMLLVAVWQSTLKHRVISIFFVVIFVAYYVFHIGFPKIYNQMLGLVQQYVIDQPFTESNGVNFIKLSNVFSN